MNILKSILPTMLLATCMAGVAQTDVTSEYVTNAGFDDGTMISNAPRGWTLELSTSGVQSKISTAEKAGGVIPGSQNHWQLWQASGALTGKAYQKLTALPAGRYRLTADISASFGGTLHLYMGKDSAEVKSGIAGTYEVEALLTTGAAEIGIAMAVDNGGTIDFDSFTLYHIISEPTDLPTIMEQWHAQCVADTLAKNRQKWYNRDEMLAALTAYAAHDGTEESMKHIIALLQAAHEHYQEITDAYTSLRAEALELYELTSDSKFAQRDSVRRIRSKIITYYVKNEDHYEWVCQSLVSLRELAVLFDWYGKLGRTINTARAQYKATNYEGKEILEEVLESATDIQTAARSVEEFAQAIEEVKAAQEAYLKNRPSEWITIQNGRLWKLSTGATVQAHAPGFVRVGDVWYMCGEDRSNWWNPDVNLYSSTDLVNWKFEKKIIRNGVTTSALGSTRMIERPKLLYNATTDKFVVWCHYESGDYGASEAACFECDEVNGDYTYVWSGRPLGIKSRDCNIFQDTDGTAYFISTTEENQHLGLFRLDEEYHAAIEHTQLFAWQSREAPAIVRIDNRYFMFSSACSGWDPNQCKLSYSNSLKSGWSGLTNVGNSIAYDTQPAAILVIKGTKKTTYLYVGDRWQDPGLPETKTIIFPIEFNGTACTFTYRERFDINFVTGEWRDTPTEEYFADKSDWNVIDSSSEETSSENGRARNAIDGKINTKWHTLYSASGGSAPHHITIDMGSETFIKGFLATPRMDGSSNGLIRNYTFSTSLDGNTWNTVSSGDWLPYCTEVDIASTHCRYIRLTCVEGSYASLAELDVVPDKDAIASVRPTTVPSAAGVVYDLTGRRVPTGSPYRGIRIADGKKYIGCRPAGE